MSKKQKQILVLASAFALTFGIVPTVSAMHIMEGYLPGSFCVAWGVLCVPFLIAGFMSIKKTLNEHRNLVTMLAMSGAFIFVISSLKIPSVTGSCSHMTGTGLGAILFGPAAVSILGLIVLLFQAILLAHGGLTTIGANTFSRGNSSVIHQAIEKLKEQGYELLGKTCMVIGNGEMGKVTAMALREAGAKVTVTVRQYRSGMVTIPPGCDRINYGERVDFLPKCDLAVSATASPNFTLTRELLEQAGLAKELILIDLAVPRDMEPAIGELPGITLYDIDSFKITADSPALRESMEKAGKILAEEIEDFYNWYQGRELIPRIQEIKAEAVEDFNLRIMKILRKTPMEESAREELLQAMDHAAGNVVNKMIFGLRDFLEPKEFISCVEGLERLYEE